MLDDPIPVQWAAPGCPAMVRRDHGQWTSCRGEPVWVGTCRVQKVGLVRMFPCDQHRDLVDDAHPMTDVDRADLDGRRVRWDRALAGKGWESPGPITEGDDPG